MNLYPLTFTPIVKDKIWGGQKLKTILGKEFGTLPNGGESWEISGVKGNISVIDNGPLAGKTLNDIIAEYGAKLLGEKVLKEFGTEFPLLIKFIDANDNLSVQVHPDDAMAQKLHNSKGKTEMWYVIAADKDGKLISGFDKKVDPANYHTLVSSGKFMEVLKNVDVKAGDVFFIPAGHVHGIGKGVMVAEIQQTSDITYRVYDYDRVDANGKGRELHIDEAQKALDFNDLSTGKVDYTPKANERALLVDCKYFNTGLLKVTADVNRDYSKVDSFVILMCVEGGVKINDEYEVKCGQTILIPASLNGITIKPVAKESKLMEVYIP